MRCYVANLTMQILQLNYRVPENIRVQTQTIEPLSQILLWKDEAPEVIRPIIDQLAVYGLVSDREVKRTRRFTGMCWREGKPVDIDAIAAAHLANLDTLEVDGATMRRESAAAAFVQARQRAYDDGAPDIRAFAMSVTEQRRGVAAHDDKMAETIAADIPGIAPHWPLGDFA